MVGEGPGIDTSFSDIAKGLGNVVKAGYEAAAASEKEEAERLAALQKAKQAIVNEVEITRRTTSFEQRTQQALGQLQEKYWNEPEKVASEYLAQAQAFADDEISNAPNPVVGLGLARSTASNIDARLKEARTWESDRQTQIIKVGLDEQLNSLAAAAEGLNDPFAVSQLLSNKERVLGPLLRQAFGVKAEEKMAEARTKTFESFLNSLSAREPWRVAPILDEKGGPIAKSLKSEDRERYRDKAKASFDGYGRIREREIISKGYDRNDRLFAAYANGSLNAETLGRERAVNTENQKLTQINPHLDEESRVRQSALLANRGKFIDTLDTIWRRQRPVNLEEDIGLVSSLHQRMEDLFKHGAKGRAKDLAEALKFQEDLSNAHGDGKVNGITFQTMFKALSLDVPKALALEVANTGWPWGRDSRQLGNLELNQRLHSDSFAKQPGEVKAAVRIRYMRAYNDASTNGAQVAPQQAKRMALRALSLETGIAIPGVE